MTGDRLHRVTHEGELAYNILQQALVAGEVKTAS